MTPHPGPRRPAPSPQAAPLWQQLQHVANFLIALRAGQSWATAQLDIEPALRSGVQAICFAVLRQLGMARALRKALVTRQPSAAADALLCAALGLLLAQRGAQQQRQGAAYEDVVIVSQAVEAAKHQVALRPLAGFINACLRRYLRERSALDEAALKAPEARHNHPAWWVQALQKDWPAQWQAVLQANGQSAPLTLRIHASKSSPALMESALAASNFVAPGEAQPVAEQGLELPRSLPVTQLPGYQEGWFSVQDAAAQLAAPMLLKALPASPERPLRILDACAAPGGKTTHLLEWAAAHHIAVEVLALDVDSQRCARIHENLQRLGLLNLPQAQVKVQAFDAALPADWHDGQAFDGILLDAPCTASGIVRRHPDIPWLRRASDVAQLAAQQKRLLQALWPLLAPGGVLLYCTCSVFKAEGSEQIEAFVAHNTDALSLPAPGHLLPSPTPPGSPMPENLLGGHDGFFYGLLRKAAQAPR